MRKISVLVVAGLCLFAFDLSFTAAMSWHGYVVEVLDGDSLRVKRGTKFYEIRLYGVDTPEYRQSYGKKAKKYTSSRIYKQTVTVEPRDKDRYGRIVALVKSQGRLLNQSLVRDGLAWVYPKYCLEQPLCQEMKKEEVRARRERRGLWREKDPLSPWEWKRLNK
jgi:endonuclease YncB( thermonuclease family)